MSKDKAEEKTDIGTLISERAREYRVRQYNERIVRAKSYFDSIDVELAFKSGATIFSTENAQLREALRDCANGLDLSIHYIESNTNITCSDLRGFVNTANKLLKE